MQAPYKILDISAIGGIMPGTLYVKLYDKRVSKRSAIEYYNITSVLYFIDVRNNGGKTGKNTCMEKI